MSLKDHVEQVGLIRKQSVIVNVFRACTACGAPGIDEFGQPVGDICPKCKSKRPQDEHKGEVWARVRRSWPWSWVVPPAMKFINLFSKD